MLARSIWIRILFPLLALGLQSQAQASTVSCELTITNLSAYLFNQAGVVRPSAPSFTAQVTGWAGAPREEVSALDKLPVTGTGEVSKVYKGGPLLEEMSVITTYGAAGTITLSTKLVGHGGDPAPENDYYWGSPAGFLLQTATATMKALYAIPQDGTYGIHLTACYAYEIVVDNTGGNPWKQTQPSLSLALSTDTPNNANGKYLYTVSLGDNTPGVHSGSMDLDLPGTFFLWAQNGHSLTITAEASVGQCFTEVPKDFGVPIPGAVWLLGSGLAGLGMCRKKRRS